MTDADTYLNLLLNMYNNEEEKAVANMKKITEQVNLNTFS